MSIEQIKMNTCEHKYECGCNKEYCASCVEEYNKEGFYPRICDNESCKHYYSNRNDNCDCDGTSCGFCNPCDCGECMPNDEEEEIDNEKKLTILSSILDEINISDEKRKKIMNEYKLSLDE